MTDINAIEERLLHGKGQESEDDLHEHRTDSEDDSESYDSDKDKRYTSDRDQPPLMDHPSLGPQSGYNTGVKGVRNDANRHAEAQRALRGDEVRATNKRMEQMALGKSRTWEEDEVDRKREAAHGLRQGEIKRDSDDDNDDSELKAIRQRRLDTLKSQAASNEARRRKMAGEQESKQRIGSNGSSGSSVGGVGGGSMFGHLREVGADNYANAIDTEDKSTFIVVHIYVKYVQACAQLTSALSSLARIHTQIKFIQVRAGSIGFGSGGKEVENEIDGDEKAQEVVPTLLVYQGGTLLTNLVRIDLEPEWKEGEERNVRNILVRYGIPL